MRPLVMDFLNDTTAIGQSYQYMFGKSFLIAPVIEPGVTDWDVYLPKSAIWYDFWTGKRFSGGQTIKTAAPRHRIPVFIKAGSIVPMGKFLQYTSEKPIDTLEIRIYAGADGQFTLYNDEGNNYNYEKGKYTLVPLKWNEERQMLTIDVQQGSYAGALKKRVFNIVWVNESNGKGIEISSIAKSVIYSGEKITVSSK